MPVEICAVRSDDVYAFLKIIDEVRCE